MMSEFAMRESAPISRNGGEISWGDEVATSQTATRSFWTSSGERLRVEPYGGFLVNFLCKENWNIDAGGT